MSWRLKTTADKRVKNVLVFLFWSSAVNFTTVKACNGESFLYLQFLFVVTNLLKSWILRDFSAIFGLRRAELVYYFSATTHCFLDRTFC